MVIIRMPANKELILNFVANIPVRQPAMNPAAMEIIVEEIGSIPSKINRAATAPPNGKLPSTVRSGKDKTRKVSAMPSATSA
jgi:hypothetical protein